MARKDSLLRLRQLLLKRRDALRKALAGDLGDLKNMERDSTGDLVDFALDSASDELSSQLADIESRELAQVEFALERMSDGNYGRCVTCTKPIPSARLQALPYATLCIECQSAAEVHGRRDRPSANFGRIDDDSSGDAEVTIDDIEMDVS